MEMDLTTQLQPALWGLLLALLAATTALLAMADRNEVDHLWRYWYLRGEWRRRLELARAFRDRLVARVAATVAYLMHQAVSRGGKV